MRGLPYTNNLPENRRTHTNESIMRQIEELGLDMAVIGQAVVTVYSYGETKTLHLSNSCRRLIGEESYFSFVGPKARQRAPMWGSATSSAPCRGMALESLDRRLCRDCSYSSNWDKAVLGSHTVKIIMQAATTLRGWHKYLCEENHDMVMCRQAVLFTRKCLDRFTDEEQESWGQVFADSRTMLDNTERRIEDACGDKTLRLHAGRLAVGFSYRQAPIPANVLVNETIGGIRRAEDEFRRWATTAPPQFTTLAGFEKLYERWDALAVTAASGATALVGVGETYLKKGSVFRNKHQDAIEVWFGPKSGFLLMPVEVARHIEESGMHCGRTVSWAGCETPVAVTIAENLASSMELDKVVAVASASVA